MSDADTAYKIAEQRIEQSLLGQIKSLSLGKSGLRHERGRWEKENRLGDLDRLPPSLSNLTQLKVLKFEGSQVKDISRLSGLNQLESINLKGTQVEDLSPLSALGKLQKLLLSGTPVVDLSPLTKLQNLQRLDIDGTGAFDLSAIENLRNLRELRIKSTSIVDLHPLKKLQNLSVLDLENTVVSDISPLSSLTSLKRLDLDRTEVTDLSPLSAMVSLKRLYLANTKVANLNGITNLYQLEALHLDNTRSKLSQLVEIGSAWEKSDNKLTSLGIAKINLDDVVLGQLAETDAGKTGASQVLARLRELRDMAPPPAVARDATPTGPFTFLSYSSNDRPAAFRLKSALEAEGLSIWWDQMIDPGMDWDAELRRRLTSAHSVLVLWSEASAVSEHVRDEAQRARRANTVAPVMIEPLNEDQLPQPFGGRHTLDLSHWDGARDDEVFQRLVSFLKLRQIGAQSPVTTRLNDEGLLELAERPVGVAPLREDEMRRSRLLRSQADLSRDIAGVIEEELGENLSNQDKRLILRTTSYERALRSNEDLIWETLDASFQRANGLVRWDELDEGMKPTVQTWRDQHGALQEFIQPAQPPEDQAPDDQVSPDDVGEVMEELAEVAADLEAAASAKMDPAPVTAPIPRLLQSHAERMARERDDPDGPSEASEQAGRSRTGKTVRAALGVLTGVAAGVTVHSWAVTGPGAPLLSRMVALAERLFALL